MSATLARLDQSYAKREADYTTASNEYTSEESGLDLQDSAPDRKVKADGQPAKRRGPKPDSKPALTRRQELNRQAQRTHRERKECYIKALEAEVLRLKETYATACHERDSYAGEVNKLKETLIANGISCPPGFARSGSTGVSSATSGSFSGSYAPPSTSAGRSPPPANGQYQNASLSPPPRSATQPMAVYGGNDYEQIGIDFVLAYDEPSPPISTLP